MLANLMVAGWLGTGILLIGLDIRGGRLSILKICLNDIRVATILICMPDSVARGLQSRVRRVTSVRSAFSATALSTMRPLLMLQVTVAVREVISVKVAKNYWPVTVTSTFVL